MLSSLIMVFPADGETARFQGVTHVGAGRGFMRAGEMPDAGEANHTARNQAWERWKTLLKKLS